MVISPVALYEKLVSDLDFTISRTTTYSVEKVPLHVKRFAAEYLKDKFLSKLIPKDSSNADFAAYWAFYTSNEKCRTWSLAISSSPEEQMVGEFLKIMEDFFLSDLGPDCELSHANIALHARCGPGAAVGASGTSHYSKMYSGELTYGDPQILDIYRADLSMWPEESCAELIRQENFGSPKLVRTSRSSFVPKTMKTSRMISVEPTLNMFYQLGLGEIITKRLKRFFGIDLSTQTSINRYLAYIGSCVDATFGDGFATIDLSSASDSISLQLVSMCVPPEWLSAILELRSRTTTVELLGKEFDDELYMVSTMGNGFTFPLQTAIFASIAAAAISMSDHVLSRPRGWGLNRPGMFSVFGDDIIVPAKCFERTLSLLRLLGFTPNSEKSFGSGSFRESCGHDYYHGHNVRPVFLRKMDTDTDLMVITNLLVEWSARLEIPLPNTIEFCIRNLDYVNFVPMGEGEDAGLRVPYSILMDFGGASNPHHEGYQSRVYTKRVTHTKRVRILDGTIHVPKGVRRFIYNPPGLLVSYLRGEIRNCSISLRNWRPVYRTKRAVSPNWDYRPTTLESPWIEGVSGSGSLAKSIDRILRPHLGLRKRSIPPKRKQLR